MPTIESYNTTEDHLRLLLQGPFGSGKSTTACRFPKPWVFDLDINLGGPLRFIRDRKLPPPVGYDIIDRLEDGKECDPKLRFQRLQACMSAAAARPDVETFVIDGATKLHDYILADVLRQQNKSAMAIQDWGFYLALWKAFINQIAAARRHFVLICHERVEKDEVDQTLKYFVMIPGQMGQIIGSLFTDVWRCETETSGVPPVVKYNVRTQPNFRFALKNSCGLPPVFQFDWSVIAKALEGTK